jgi:TolB protein
VAEADGREVRVMRTISDRLPTATVASLVLLSTLVLGPATPASATFPGANGKIAFVRSTEVGASDVWVMDPDGRNQRRLTWTGLAGAPTWSADGTKIAFAQLASADGTSDVWVMNADGSGKRRVTTNAASESGPTWSPDGRWLAFASDRTGTGEIYRIRSTRPYGHPVRLTFTEPPTSEGDFLWNGAPAWSPDGRRIAFSQLYGNDMYYGNDFVSLGLMRADGSRLRVTTMWNEAGTLVYTLGPSWGPGGAFLAWSHNKDYYEDPPTNVYRSAAGSTTGIEVTHYADWEADWISGPSWSPSYGTQIVYSAEVGGTYRPAIYRIASNGTGNPTLIARNAEAPDWGVATG